MTSDYQAMSFSLIFVFVHPVFPSAEKSMLKVSLKRLLAMRPHGVAASVYFKSGLRLTEPVPAMIFAMAA